MTPAWLLDIKMVYAGLGYQAKWNIQGKAVLIKQHSVTGAYIRKAKKADREFNPGITPGPVRKQRFEFLALSRDWQQAHQVR